VCFRRGVIAIRRGVIAIALLKMHGPRNKQKKCQLEVLRFRVRVVGVSSSNVIGVIVHHGSN
jgi:hypothetical protein